MIILGNKADKDSERAVSYKEAERFAKIKNLLYFETSALNMQNINEAFESMVKQILETKENDEEKDDRKEKLRIKRKKKKEIKKQSSGCC